MKRANLDRTARRAAILFDERQRSVWRRSDRLFAVLLLGQWLAGMAFFWSELSGQIHSHILLAFLLAGCITGVSIVLAWFRIRERKDLARQHAELHTAHEAAKNGVLMQTAELRDPAEEAVSATEGLGSQFQETSGELIRLLLDSNPEAIYGIDVRGNCTFCNAACLQLLGYSKAADVLGLNMHNLIHHTRADGTAYPAEQCHT